MAPARAQEFSGSDSSETLDHEPRRNAADEEESPRPPARREYMPTATEPGSMLLDMSTELQAHLASADSTWQHDGHDAPEVAANQDIWSTKQEPAMHRKLARENDPRLRSHSVSSVAPGDTGLSETRSLEVAGCFLFPLERDITADNMVLYLNLLIHEQPIPQGSLFRDDIFGFTRRKMRAWDKARLFRYITPLVVPSVENLAAAGSTQLECLVESLNEEWTNSLPLAGLPPRPDYSVGFRHAAFSDHQVGKLRPFIGRLDAHDPSLFMGTSNMYFPFLSCHVVPNGDAVHAANLHTGHSMALAVRGVVELFRLFNREDEVHRQALAFSVIHNCMVVQVYAHYAEIHGETTKYFRQEIRNFDLEAFEGKDRWAAYCFTRNIYDIWMPLHLQMIRSAVDQLMSPCGDAHEDDIDPPGHDMDVGPAVGMNDVAED
ncbi:hypothetical protein TOPH_06212 [Tolypocladium ophioglossoides CBS 100239]|uniref:DUF7924 domain-containing protein n=1 Tax=Tolypocladium ophioglossoides (strain CBS 100239) TaxID=1163406 RepID=A0A0L0N4Z5_TOLOC|nr:hypothetical protein TOPH_06212 [Tolypocladium ophioglossoides CBS 100239]